MLAITWWLETDRSVAPKMGALAIGLLGTAIATAGARKPAPTRGRVLLAAGIGAIIAAALVFLVRR
ncbi:MAG: hypothetical protein EXR66_06735 [Dehalococcoidia bacterium]|nr:hypothetical protein [Dehalococcoidia bacterium]